MLRVPPERDRKNRNSILNWLCKRSTHPPLTRASMVTNTHLADPRPSRCAEFIDEASVAVLGHLLEHFPSGGSACLLIMGCRSREGVTHETMAPWLKREDVSHLQLQPLDAQVHCTVSVSQTSSTINRSTTRPQNHWGIVLARQSPRRKLRGWAHSGPCVSNTVPPNCTVHAARSMLNCTVPQQSNAPVSAKSAPLFSFLHLASAVPLCRSKNTRTPQILFMPTRRLPACLWLPRPRAVGCRRRLCSTCSAHPRACL